MNYHSGSKRSNQDPVFSHHYCLWEKNFLSGKNLPERNNILKFFFQFSIPQEIFMGKIFPPTVFFFHIEHIEQE